jgi:hypothetical protein
LSGSRVAVGADCIIAPITTTNVPTTTEQASDLLQRLGDDGTNVDGGESADRLLVAESLFPE